jgi:hypothetical protein
VNEPSGLRASVPCAGPLTRTAVSGSPSPSVSFASRPAGAGTVSGVSSVAAYESGAATGDSFAGNTSTTRRGRVAPSEEWKSTPSVPVGRKAHP